ncbi:saposin B domain-containing protein [Heterostelium album PN500]|uniref:Saposin B domain-containing protein n=1 Tax=Heterostelium pallidum (strain ATCC 26659 / Pp 5 / PN500) TaxID=670386 RepID=D3B868_HETP5|nr:saposin B domain-containing protein [Heterostelium album PN500]EFA82236.1 saposin B domain-containing protein [Heterostelium album PN500]|eukprot:XP_020434353.1 saposin B domain-containing protein [Heterostelium album PN500]
MNKFLIITLLSVLALTYVNSVSIQISGLAKESTNATVECELCALTVNATEYLIKHENYTQKQVEAELKKICTVVPSNMTKECDLFMLIAAPVITTFITNNNTEGLFDGESGTELCAKYHMCPKSEEYKSLIGYQVTPMELCCLASRMLCFVLVYSVAESDTLSHSYI